MGVPFKLQNAPPSKEIELKEGDVLVPKLHEDCLFDIGENIKIIKIKGQRVYYKYLSENEIRNRHKSIFNSREFYTKAELTPLWKVIND